MPDSSQTRLSARVAVRPIAMHRPHNEEREIGLRTLTSNLYAGFGYIPLPGRIDGRSSNHRLWGLERLPMG